MSVILIPLISLSPRNWPLTFQLHQNKQNLKEKPKTKQWKEEDKEEKNLLVNALACPVESELTL